jgi:hypothetical protein
LSAVSIATASSISPVTLGVSSLGFCSGDNVNRRYATMGQMLKVVRET